MLRGLVQDPGASIIKTGLTVKTSGFPVTPLCFHLIKSYHIPEGSKLYNITKFEIWSEAASLRFLVVIPVHSVSKLAQ